MSKVYCKICDVCKTEKELSGFYFRKDNNTYRNKCKQCSNKQTLNYYYKNHKLELERKNRYAQKHRNELKIYIKKYHKTHLEEIKQYKQNYYLKNKFKIKKQKKKYHTLHKQERANYIKQRQKTDINFHILMNLRKRISKVIKRNKKSNSTKILLGCSLEYFKNYIFLKFKQGMSWDNYGTGYNNKGMQEWHIDHIRACASFNLSKSEEQRKCFHYSNLQPLWAKENWSKGAKHE